MISNLVQLFWGQELFRCQKWFVSFPHQLKRSLNFTFGIEKTKLKDAFDKELPQWIFMLLIDKFGHMEMACKMCKMHWLLLTQTRPSWDRSGKVIRVSNSVDNSDRAAKESPQSMTERLFWKSTICLNPCRVTFVFKIDSCSIKQQPGDPFASKRSSRSPWSVTLQKDTSRFLLFHFALLVFMLDIWNI